MRYPDDFLNKNILGDCVEIMKSIPDESVDAIVTDPPFGIGFKYHRGRETIDDADEYWFWLKPIYDEMMRCLKKGGFLAMWQTTLYMKNLWTWYGDDIHVYISCKNFVQIRKTPINYAYDPIVMKYKAGAIPLRPETPKRSIDYFVANTANFVTKKDNLCRQHPCPRPIDQTEAIIDNFVIPNGVVFDPFMGSGTTAIACLKHERKFIGVEIEGTYIEIANERIKRLRAQELFE